MREPAVRLAAPRQFLRPEFRYLHRATPRPAWAPQRGPSLLVSYVHLSSWLPARPDVWYEDWSMDSGGFTAFWSGKPVVLEAYIDTCKRLLAEDPTLTEVFVLDDIGDWHVTARNLDRMWSEGVPAIPIYHFGEPWSVLETYQRTYPGVKLAIGGAVKAGPKVKIRQARTILARAWPARVHGLGFGSETSVMTLPFHSTDSTNWAAASEKYGVWCAFRPHARLRVRQRQGIDHAADITWFMDLEARAGRIWKKEMAMLKEKLPPWPRQP